MIVFPDDLPDTEKWYRLQHMFIWYNVLACCRSCATRKLHEHAAQFGERAIATWAPWLVRLNGDPCEAIIPGIGQCELVIKDHPLDGRGRPVHQRGPCKWNGGIVVEEGGLRYAQLTEDS